MMAIRMCLEGNSRGVIDCPDLEGQFAECCELGQAIHERLLNAHVPKRSKVAELDELFTYVG